MSCFVVIIGCDMEIIQFIKVHDDLAIIQNNLIKHLLIHLNKVVINKNMHKTIMV